MMMLNIKSVRSATFHKNILEILEMISGKSIQKSDGGMIGGKYAQNKGVNSPLCGKQTVGQSATFSSRFAQRFSLDGRQNISVLRKTPER